MKSTTRKELAEAGGITQRQCDILKTLAAKKTITGIIMALALPDTVRSNVRYNANRLAERAMVVVSVNKRLPSYLITERGIQAIKAYERGGDIEPMECQYDTGIVRAPTRSCIAIPILPMKPWYRNNGNMDRPSLGAFGGRCNE